MNVSEFIFDYFAEKGIDTVFMITGGQAMWLDDAVGKDTRYKKIFNAHEQACSMAADAYGRIKNKPAICLVTAGPGALNAINGVVGGFTDSSPMIVISGHTNLSFVRYQNNHNIRQYGVQGINIGPLVKPVVKYFVSIDDPSRLCYELEKAYHIAVSGRPGPVWIEVPLDLQKANVGIQKSKYLPEECRENSVVVCQTVDETIKFLKKTKRPIFLIGQGVSLGNARRECIEVIERLRIPVLTSRLGIDLIPSDNELYVGRPGNYGERSANFAIQNADLIICVGCRLASSLVGHSPEKFGKHAYIIHVDIDSEELNKPGPNIDFKAQINSKSFFNELNSRVLEGLCCVDEWIKQCQYWKDTYPVVQLEYRKSTPINSYHFVDRLSELTPENAMITVDTGSCFHVACQTWKIKKGQKFLTTGGISSMGYWCAGIGACMANNSKTTIVITGDGSLQMNIQEFATIKSNNLPIKVFILNNNGYLLIRQTQHNFMEDRFVGESPATGVWCPDSLKIAEAYEIKGIRIDSVEDIDKKIVEVMNYNGPVICEIMTSEWQLLIPRVASDKLADGTLVSREYSDMFPYLDKEEYKKNMVSEK